MLARHEEVIDPVADLPKLAEGKTPKARPQDVAHKAVKPWRADLLVDSIVRLAVASKLYVGAQYRIDTLVDHA